MDRGTCRFHGGPREECPDDQRDWYPQRSICWPSAQLAAAERKYLALHEEQPYHDGTQTIFSEKPTKMTPFHVMDGMSFSLSERDDNPDDDFTTNKYAKYAKSPPATS
jgi:hypothetical protein